MQLVVIAICVLLFASYSNALYSGKNSVIELTSANFNDKVLRSDEIWVVEFFALWCGHCQSLAPEYSKLADAAKGFFKVGAVNMDEHQDVGQPYNVKGFPTIKIFGANKQKPIDYQGARDAQAIAESAINELRKTVISKLGKGGKAYGSKKSDGDGSGGDVVELTDSNFDELVLNSNDIWMVEFFAPWCGHCKSLKPHWDRAATELKGKVKLGALDATMHRTIASRFEIKGFPTIKYFPSGSSAENAVDYDGGRSSGDIVQWALNKFTENIEAPEVVEVVSKTVVDEACKNKQLCIISVLPHILDCQSSCRNDYLKVLNELAEKFKRNMWGWLWTEAGKQPALEEAFGMGGFGYPAMAAANFRKMKFSILKGSFGSTGIGEFLRELSYGRGQTAPIKGAEFPVIAKVDSWDGKDGEMPVEEDLDLSDVDLDEEDDIDREKTGAKEKSEL